MNKPFTTIWWMALPRCDKGKLQRGEEIMVEGGLAVLGFGP
jgi:hypothetical protein